MTQRNERQRKGVVDLILSKWPLVVLEYLLAFFGLGVFVFRRLDWVTIFTILAYTAFLVWNVTYYLVWRHWDRNMASEHARVKPKTPDVHGRIIEATHGFSNAGITAVSILLPANLAVIGFLFDKKPVAGLLEPAFYFTVSLAVALWNLSRLPSMVHREETNVAYDFWTAFLEMVQLSTLILGVIRLLTVLFVLFGK